MARSLRGPLQGQDGVVQVLLGRGRPELHLAARDDGLVNEAGLETARVIVGREVQVGGMGLG